MISRDVRNQLRGGGRHRIAAPLAVVLLFVVGMVLGAGPAAASQSNANFVTKAHRDFLLRDPTGDEVTWWTAYLGGNSRASMIQNVLNSSEFSFLWVAGVRLQYLGELDPGSSEFSAAVSALNSTRDYVATEVSVLSGSAFFSLAGGTNDGFMDLLYEKVLYRPADSSGRAYWAGRLDAGTSRASVANYFIRTTEAASRRVAGPSGATSCNSTELSDPSAVESGAYCLILDRPADSGGTTYWTGVLRQSGQLPQLFANLGGSTEYYNKAQQ